MGTLNDMEIRELCQQGKLIEGWSESSKLVDDQAISFGISSFGYDMRLGWTFTKPADLEDVFIDPKFAGTIMDQFVQTLPFFIGSGEYLLAVSVERFMIPDNVWGLVLGKSTYARCGLIVNATPMEPGWEGYLTLELSNPTKHDIVLYPMEGIAQVMFFTGNPPAVNYRTKNGKYQNQPNVPVMAKLK